MLKLIDIKKDYKVADTKVHALKGINLEFRKNEFVCILGPSGCGKTTLLNIIGGLDQYTSGDLEIGGRSTKDFGDRDWDVYRNHQIGFIFQSYNLIPHQTVLGNVELALTIAGIGKEERRERAKQALERVGLGAELGKRPNQLSGGQMQRVAIARALVNNPAILLADEPTGALDSKTSVQIMDLIREISGERLVIMVTHNPELAEQYASRLVCLKDGLVASDSNPSDGAEDRAAEAQQREEEFAALTPEEQAKAKEEKKKQKKRDSHAKMSFFTALALSFRNLLTKKGRTIITSIAGSIGIISVCLVLALSSGFNNYIKRTEEDMLSYYPVQITESTYDMAAMMTSFTAQKDMPDLSELDNEVYIDSFLTGLANGMAVKNNITSDYIDYVEKIDPAWVSAIQYGYGTRLVDNLFTEVDTMEGEDETNLTLTTRSLSNLKTHYIEVLRTQASQYSQLTYMADFFGNIVNKMPGTTKVGSDDFGKYVLSQYDVLEGHFPKKATEIVLVV
ncbi:MAG: ABC transporter ATP-binding protein, partial [Clostridiales bacterium]|nr:ABC transporter ATP-binding protein [Clostridiales bacterium]